MIANQLFSRKFWFVTGFVLTPFWRAAWDGRWRGMVSETRPSKWPTAWSLGPKNHLKPTGRVLKIGCCWLVGEKVGYEREGGASEAAIFWLRPLSLWAWWTLLSRSRRKMGADVTVRVLVCGTLTGSSWKPGSPPSPHQQGSHSLPTSRNTPSNIPTPCYPPPHCEASKVKEFGVFSRILNVQLCSNMLTTQSSHTWGF